MSTAMAARLAWAMMTALVLGVWLWRRSRDAEALLTPRMEQSAALLRRAVLWLCAFWSVTWLVLALARLPYPFELEWSGGAMRDHCERVLAGQPLYVPPGPDWFPYEYPPLYFWISALLMRLTGGSSFLAMRLVSILSTLGCAWLLFAWVKRQGVGEKQEKGERRKEKETRGRNRRLSARWGFIAAGLFLATYRFTGAWYDIERLDMLFLFLSLLGVYWLERALLGNEGVGCWVLGVGEEQGTEGVQVSRYPGIQDNTAAQTPEHPTPDTRHPTPNTLAAGAALALSLAFLTKQQAILFLVGGVAALAWRRAWKPLAVFSLVALVVCGDAVWFLNATTNGWFGYYCFRVPLANGMEAHLAKQYIADLALFAPILALLAAMVGRKWGDGETGKGGGRDAVLVMMTAMGVLGSLMSRAHWGGDQNVLITGFVFLGTAGCILAARWEQANHRIAAPLYALLCVQLLTLTYRPDAQLPTAANRAAGQRFRQIIHALQTQGEVLCMDHGNVTTPRHFQTLGLRDVMNTAKGLPPALAEALNARRFVAIVLDALPEPGTPLGDAILRNYAAPSPNHPVENPRLGGPWVVTGYPTPPGDGRLWVLRPR